MNKQLSCAALLFLCINMRVYSSNKESSFSENLIRRYQSAYPDEFKHVVDTFRNALNRAQNVIETYINRTELINVVTQLKKLHPGRSLDTRAELTLGLWDKDSTVLTISFLEDYLTGRAHKLDFVDAQRYLDNASKTELSESE